MSEHLLPIETDSGIIPCSIFEASGAKGVVLLGHGLGVDRHDETVLRPTRVLNDSGLSVVVPELPLHGERSEGEEEWAAVVAGWQGFWASEGRDQMLQEWLQILAHVSERFNLPVLYFGLSLGTQYGVLFLAQAHEVKAAVLGLFGSEPPPKSKIMNLFASKVSMPVYFIQKLDDELHPAQNTKHLYDSLGSSQKVLDASPGLHGDVSRESVLRACTFLAGQADA